MELFTQADRDHYDAVRQQLAKIKDWELSVSQELEELRAFKIEHDAYADNILNATEVVTQIREKYQKEFVDNYIETKGQSHMSFSEYLETTLRILRLNK